MKVFWIVLLSIAFIVSFLIPLDGLGWGITICVPLIAIVRLIMSKHVKKFLIVQLCIIWIIGVIILFVDNREAAECSYHLLDIVSIEAIVVLIVEAVKWRDNSGSDTQTSSYSPTKGNLWTCSYCSKTNNSSASSCWYCGKDRSLSVTEESNSNYQNGRPKTLIHPDSNGLWRCPDCNNENMMSAYRCISCGKDRPRSVTEEHNSKYETNSSGTWNCPICGMRNKNGYPRCLSCNTENPNYIPETQSEQPTTSNRSKVDLRKNEPGGCGTSGAPNIVFCRKCGTKMPGDSLFCQKCGTKISWGVIPSKNV